jgi:hypothetical protein
MSWIQTYTGRKFYPLCPRSQDVCIEDIAHALALECRYTGHCREFFSVAQHSVMVSEMLSGEAAIWGLLHDAAEAYLCDLAKPIKWAFQVINSNWGGTCSFAMAESRILLEVAKAFNLDPMIPECVHGADLRCLEWERRQLMGAPPEEWATAKYWDGTTTPIECWGPLTAEWKFLCRWNELRKPLDGTF